MPFLYEDPNNLRTRSYSKKKSFQSVSSGKIFVLGGACGLGLGFFIFTALGREMVKKAAGLTEAELRKRIAARKGK